jgi:hypothetical protein
MLYPVSPCIRLKNKELQSALLYQPLSGAKGKVNNVYEKTE